MGELGEDIVNYITRRSSKGKQGSKNKIGSEGALCHRRAGELTLN